MMKRLRLFVSISILLSLLTTSPVWAGSQQNGEQLFTIEELVHLSKKIEKTLAQKGVRVFIIARSGRSAEDLPKGIEYTHVAFGMYSKIQTKDGQTIPGYAFYNLYQDDIDLSQSKLVTDYTIDFLSSVHQTKVGIVIPTPELQKRLLNFIGTKEYQALHNAKYSVMSNPNNTIFQNCTEYVLDVINSVIYQTVNKVELKQAAKDHFEAQVIHMSPFKLMLGSMFVSGVSAADHSGTIKTTTYTTIAKYLNSFDLAQEVLTIEL